MEDLSNTILSVRHTLTSDAHSHEVLCLFKGFGHGTCLVVRQNAKRLTHTCILHTHAMYPVRLSTLSGCSA